MKTRLSLYIDGQLFGSEIEYKDYNQALKIGKQHIKDALTHDLYGFNPLNAGYRVKNELISHGKTVRKSK